MKYATLKYLFSLGLTIALLIVGLYPQAFLWVSFVVQIPLRDYYYHHEGKKRAYLVIILSIILAIVCYAMGWILAFVIWCLSVFASGMFLRSEES
jgi:hypothetical protein